MECKYSKIERGQCFYILPISRPRSKPLKIEKKKKATQKKNNHLHLLTRKSQTRKKTSSTNLFVSLSHSLRWEAKIFGEAESKGHGFSSTQPPSKSATPFQVQRKAPSPNASSGKILLFLSCFFHFVIIIDDSAKSHCTGCPGWHPWSSRWEAPKRRVLSQSWPRCSYPPWGPSFALHQRSQLWHLQVILSPFNSPLIKPHFAHKCSFVLIPSLRGNKIRIPILNQYKISLTKMGF